MAVTMTKAVLEEKYNSMTMTELSKELGVSKVTIYSYLRNAGIELKGGNKKVVIQ